MPTFDYRRELTPRQLIPAVGVGMGVGLVAAYLTRILLQRTPLRPRPADPAAAGWASAPKVRR